jgi:hypothetical protein
MPTALLLFFVPAPLLLETDLTGTPRRLAWLIAELLIASSIYFMLCHFDVPEPLHFHSRARTPRAGAQLGM